MSFIKILLLILICMMVLNLGPAFAKDLHHKKLLVIDSQAGEPYESVRTSLIKELAKEGYTEGKNLEVVYYSLGNFEGKAINVWGKESGGKYDVIFLNGTIAVQAFKKLSLNDTNKFVFASITDPVGVGVIESFYNPPKNNFTGICFPIDVRKRLRFIKKLMPNASKIGLIYADMPQSQSYRRWVDEALNEAEFKDLKVIYRSVDFIKSEGGHRRMSLLAQKYVEELNPIVDVFLAPNDQMGAQDAFAKMLFSVATKPLIGLGRKDVMEGWGATAAIYPDLPDVGKRAANMIVQLFEGKTIKQIPPEWPSHIGMAIDLIKAKRFNIKVSEELLKTTAPNLIQ